MAVKVGPSVANNQVLYRRESPGRLTSMPLRCYALPIVDKVPAAKSGIGKRWWRKAVQAAPTAKLYEMGLKLPYAILKEKSR